MPPSDNITTGMENFTSVGLRKFNLTDQEFHIKNVSKAEEFRQENQTITGTYILKQHMKMKGSTQFKCI